MSDLVIAVVAAMTFAAGAYATETTVNCNDANREHGYTKTTADLATLTPKQVAASSGNEYWIFCPGSLAADFVLKRPLKSDRGVAFCVPAAFTTSHGAVDGIAISHGHRFGVKTESIGGAVAIIGSDLTVFGIEKGTKLNERFLTALQDVHGSLFQQFQLVRYGAPEKFRDKSLFYRRAIIVYKNFEFVVVESCQPTTMNQLALDLVSLGAESAAYMDMGAWDEGWYRQDGVVKIIGQDRSATASQCNWLVFKSPLTSSSASKPGSAARWVEKRLYH